MAGADELCAQLLGREGVEYVGRPDGAAYVRGLDWAGVVVAPPDTFLIRDQRCDRVGALDRIADIERMRGDIEAHPRQRRFSPGNEWKTQRVRL